MTTDESEILRLNQRLLESILSTDWKTYSELCDESLTAFEPEAVGQLVAGLAFHKFYFDLGAAPGPRQVTMASPHIRLLGNTAVVSYVRLVQKRDSAGQLVTAATEETRVWHKKNDRWKHVHFHRSEVNKH